jgi:hypothetical protein
MKLLLIGSHSHPHHSLAFSLTLSHTLSHSRSLTLTLSHLHIHTLTHTLSLSLWTSFLKISVPFRDAKHWQFYGSLLFFLSFRCATQPNSLWKAFHSFNLGAAYQTLTGDDINSKAKKKFKGRLVLWLSMYTQGILFFCKSVALPFS